MEIFNLRVEIHKDNLDEIVERSCCIAKESGVQEENLFSYRLAVDEIFTNSLKHAYNNDKGYIHIAAKIDKNYLVTEIEDYGSGFQASNKLYDENEICSQLKNCGKGLLIVKKFTDRVEIVSLPGKGTTVKFYMKLAKTANPS